MDPLTKRLDSKLRKWRAETSKQVRIRVTEIIELADRDALELMRSRTAEQEVLDLIDAPKTR